VAAPFDADRTRAAARGGRILPAMLTRLPRSTHAVLVATLLGLATSALPAQSPQSPAELLLAPAVLRAMDEEISGTIMRDHVAYLASLHRVPASPGYHAAAEWLMAKQRSYGLDDVHVETFPGDGRTWFGTMRGNRGWRVEGGELTELAPQPRRIGSFDDLNMLVADNSESADVTAELVDVGSGTSPDDYAAREVRGKLVLCDGPPSAAHRLAVEERGAAGLISYNANQRTGWWRDDADLVRWGHLDGRGRQNTFALMISLREARELRRRLAAGETIRLHAVVRAGNDDSIPYETVIATIPGTDPSRGEIVFSCHFDHQKPAANDNASGCAAILEIGRVVRKLVDEKKIAPPMRTMRFVFPSEMIGTIAYLTKYPDIAARMRAAIHLDMVGGEPSVTKSVLHVTRSPWSAASVTDDVAETFARYVIDGAYEGTASGDFSRAIREPNGPKDALWADVTEYESGSDHWIYQEGSFAVPTIYLRDWPDVYIHTNRDVADHVNPTKIKRAAFIAAASGYFLANLNAPSGPSDAAFPYLVLAGAMRRMAEALERSSVKMWGTPDAAREAMVVVSEARRREERRVRTLERFDYAPAGSPGAQTLAEVESDVQRLFPVGQPSAPEAPDARVPWRNADVRGPLAPSVDWVRDRAGTAAAGLAIARIPRGDDVAYEVVNYIDGKRTVSEIRDAVSAEFGPVDVGVIAEYLELLAKIGAIRLAG
jgi:aminopeptidase YwaD